MTRVVVARARAIAGCGLIAAAGLAGVGCTPEQPRGHPSTTAAPDAPLADIHAEPVSAFQPPGVTLERSIDVPADPELHPLNHVAWSFSAPDEATMVIAAEAVLSNALGEGWAGEPFAGGANGVFATTLRKGSMTFDITYHRAPTSPDDVIVPRVLKVDCVITYDPSLG